MAVAPSDRAQTGKQEDRPGHSTAAERREGEGGRRKRRRSWRRSKRTKRRRSRKGRGSRSTRKSRREAGGTSQQEGAGNPPWEKQEVEAGGARLDPPAAGRAASMLQWGPGCRLFPALEA